MPVSYKQMANQPSPVDLPQLWDKLGLSLNGRQVVFNDHALDAAIRETITSPHGGVFRKQRD